MSSAKRAAIDLDEIGNLEMGKVTAADFLAALDAGGLTPAHLVVWPEKKKVELWVEPEDFHHVLVIDVIRVIRNEKKKVERELPFGLIELPAYEALVDRLARDIEAKLGR